MRLTLFIAQYVSWALFSATWFESYEAVIKIANDYGFGLLSGIHTRHMTKVLRSRKEINEGIVFINAYNWNVLGTPLEGVKQSSYRRGHCIETL